LAAYARLKLLNPLIGFLKILIGELVRITKVCLAWLKNFKFTGLTFAEKVEFPSCKAGFPG